MYHLNLKAFNADNQCFEVIITKLICKNLPFTLIKTVIQYISSILET